MFNSKNNFVQLYFTSGRAELHLKYFSVYLGMSLIFTDFQQYVCLKNMQAFRESVITYKEKHCFLVRSAGGLLKLITTAMKRQNQVVV